MGEIIELTDRVNMELPKYDAVRILGGNNYAVRKGYKWGLLDSKNQILLRIVYDYISEEDGKLWVRFQGYKFYVQKENLPMKYDCIFEFVEYGANIKLAKIALNGKLGVINQDYNEIVPCEFDEITALNEILRARKNFENDKKMYAAYSFDGDLRSNCIYEEINYPIIKRSVLGKTFYGIIDMLSKTILEDNITFVNSFRFSRRSKKLSINLSWYLYDIETNNGFHYIYSVDKGLIDKGYNIIEECKISNKRYIFGQRFLVYPHYDDSISKAEWSIEHLSPTITDIYYEDNYLLSINSDECDLMLQILDDLFIYKSKKNNKYGLINRNGYEIPSIYDELFFDERLHIIVGIRDSLYDQIQNISSYNHFTKETKRIGGVVDIYNEQGNIIVHELNYCEWKSARSFGYLGYYGLIINGSRYIFKDGHLIVPPHLYDEIGSFLLDHGAKYGCSGPYTDAEYALVRKGEKWGVVNSDGDLLIPVEYEEISGFFRSKVLVGKSTYFKDKYIKAKRNGKYQFFEANKTLKRVDDNIINDILNYYKEDSKYLQSDENELIEDISKDVLSDMLRKREILSKWYCIVWNNQDANCVTVEDKKTKKIGLIDATENKLCEFVFDKISEFDENGIAIAKIEGEGDGLINKFGEIILACKYEILAGEHNSRYSLFKPDFQNGYLRICLNGKFGLVNKEGHIIVPCIYPEIVNYNIERQWEFVQNGYVLVKEKTYRGLVQIQNPQDYTLNCVYNEIRLHSNSKFSGVLLEPDNYIVALNDNLCDIINLKTGQSVTTIKGLDIQNVCIIVDECVVLEIIENDSTFYRVYPISKNGLSVDFSNIGKLNGNYLQVSRNNKWGLFDITHCCEIISCEYEEMGLPVSNISVIKKDRKYGFLDILLNQMIIDNSYDKAFPFHEGLAAIQKQGFWGYINKNNQRIADGYEAAHNFCEGLAAVKKGGKWGYIDIHGKVVIPFRFEKAQSFSDGLAAVAFKIRYGYIDYNNKTIIPFKYNYAFPFKEGIAEVSDNGGSGTISKNGKEIDWEYNRQEYYDDTDYARNTWDAMTDGMYGDYPDEGYDGDYSFMGH